MENIYTYSILLSITIGCIVFLVQQTDFIYEYLSLFFNLIRFKEIGRFLKFDTYENSNGFENYIIFLGSVYGVKNNVFGFITRLITCFLCLNWLLCVLAGLLITKNIMLIMPSFLISVIIFYILFHIKKTIFS
jgi:hypothetical protein